MMVAAPTRITDQSLRQFAGYTMKRAFNAIRADVTAALAPFELRMVTFSALSVIVENPGLRQSQLADALLIERPNIVALVDELVRHGLVEKAKSSTDRRALSLVPTLLGVDSCARATAAVAAHDRRMTAALSSTARTELIEMLKSIERAGEGLQNDGVTTA
ncbi:MAG: MarR family transcriptional regulator [Pseudomonadota bacterium]